MLRLPILLPLLFLPACATVIKGSTQEVKFTSEPSGALCSLDRTGAQLGLIPATPGSAMVSRSGTELVVTCTKPGFEKTAATVKSGFNGVTFGNLLIGGIVGVIVDASTGANFSYPDTVNVMLPASSASPAMPAAPVVPAPYTPGSPIVLQPTKPAV